MKFFWPQQKLKHFCFCHLEKSSLLKAFFSYLCDWKRHFGICQKRSTSLLSLEIYFSPSAAADFFTKQQLSMQKLVSYSNDVWNKRIMHQNIHILLASNSSRANTVVEILLKRSHLQKKYQTIFMLQYFCQKKLEFRNIKIWDFFGVIFKHCVW